MMNCPIIEIGDFATWTAKSRKYNKTKENRLNLTHEKCKNLNSELVLSCSDKQWITQPRSESFVAKEIGLCSSQDISIFK